MKFWIQASNPRTVNIVDEEDKSIFDAMQTIFLSWAEDAIMVWDGIYIPLNYNSIISFMLADVLIMLERLMEDGSGKFTINWPSSDFAAIWILQWDDDRLDICAEWNSVVGRTELLLASHSKVTLGKEAFVAEWKQVLGIILEALVRAGYKDAYLTDMTKLRQLFEKIREPGVLYR